jgi:hypothetical protein
VSLAAALVFWLFDALPFQDLPAHAGLIALRHRIATSPFEQQYFVFAPHIGPYSLFRFLGEQLTQVIGPTGAVRAIATLPVLATPLALLLARKRLHGDLSPTFGFFGVVLSFGLMTLFGFASYLLGIPVMLVGVTLWLELLATADDPSQKAVWPEVRVALYAPFIFVAHGHAFVLFLGIAAVSTLAAGDRLRRIVRLRALLPALALAAYVAWIERGTNVPDGSAPLAESALHLQFQGALDKFSLLITPTLMTRTGIDFLVGLLLWIFVLSASVASIRATGFLRSGTGAGSERAFELQRGRDARSAADAAGSTGESASVRHTRALLAAAVAIMAVFLILPHSIGWFGFVDGRLVPIALLLALTAIRREALGPSVRAMADWGAPLLAASTAVLALVASYRFQAEARGYREVLAEVPAQSRLLNLPLDPNSDIFTAHPFVHYDKLVLTERPVVVSDLWFHQGSAIYPTRENPSLRLPSSYNESDLRAIDWPNYRLEDWDYALIRTRVDAMEPATPGALRLVSHQGGWWLYQIERERSDGDAP